METYAHEHEYLKAVKERAQLPEGFLCSGARIEFQPAECPSEKPRPMNLSLLLLDKPTDLFAGVFTKNSFPGAPVIIGRERLKEQFSRGVLVNNKVANVCAPGGIEDAEAVLSALGNAVGCNTRELFPASTGVIGWKLPTEAMIRGIPELVKDLKTGTALQFAQGIMTTDRYPKVRSARIGSGRIVGFAKGAGMLEPNMGTMLVFLVTDIAMQRSILQEALEYAAEKTFNRISIDGDQSTSDMALIFSSGRKPEIGVVEFRNALVTVCRDLCYDIVRNGEGTAHVIEVHVEGAISESIACAVGKNIVNSPLVKTAVYGNDPNVGRILAAIGDYMGNNGLPIDRDAVTVSMGNEIIFSHGAFRLDSEKEKRLSSYLASTMTEPDHKGFPKHERNVEIGVDLGCGAAEATILGSDLSYEYVRENADYRT